MIDQTAGMVVKRPGNIDSLQRYLTEQLAGFSESAPLDAQVLIAHASGKTRTWVLSHPQERLSPVQRSWLDTALAKLTQGEPLPYILGYWEFFGLTFKVSPAVLIPRPETELLVEHALAWCGRRSEAGYHSLTCADTGTGSGCIAISLAANLRDGEPLGTITASDISQEALEIARQNMAAHKVSRRMTLLQADLLSTYRDESLDLICANLPYIPSEVLPSLAVIRSEPALALDGGPGGLAQNLSLLEQTARCLRPGGMLLAEIETSQGEAVMEAAHSRFDNGKIDLFQDLGGRDRLLGVQMPER